VLFQEKNTERRFYLSELETVVNLVLEWTHCDLTDQFWLDDRLLHDKRQEKTQVWNNQIRLVVRGRVESGECQTTIFKFRVPKHEAQHVDQRGLQNCVECFIAVWEGIANSLDDHSSNRRGRVLEVVLNI